MWFMSKSFTWKLLREFYTSKLSSSVYLEAIQVSVTLRTFSTLTCHKAKKQSLKSLFLMSQTSAVMRDRVQGQHHPFPAIVMNLHERRCNFYFAPSFPSRSNCNWILDVVEYSSKVEKLLFVHQHTFIQSLLHNFPYWLKLCHVYYWKSLSFDRQIHSRRKWRRRKIFICHLSEICFIFYCRIFSVSFVDMCQIKQSESISKRWWKAINHIQSCNYRKQKSWTLLVVRNRELITATSISERQKISFVQLRAVVMCFPQGFIIHPRSNSFRKLRD